MGLCRTHQDQQYLFFSCNKYCVVSVFKISKYCLAERFKFLTFDLAVVNFEVDVPQSILQFIYIVRVNMGLCQLICN